MHLHICSELHCLSITSTCLLLPKHILRRFYSLCVTVCFGKDMFEFWTYGNVWLVAFTLINLVKTTIEILTVTFLCDRKYIGLNIVQINYFYTLNKVY